MDSEMIRDTKEGEIGIKEDKRNYYFSSVFSTIHNIFLTDFITFQTLIVTFKRIFSI